jgi:hypothetical protein
VLDVVRDPLTLHASALHAHLVGGEWHGAGLPPAALLIEHLLGRRDGTNAQDTRFGRTGG